MGPNTLWVVCIIVGTALSATIMLAGLLANFAGGASTAVAGLALVFVSANSLIWQYWSSIRTDVVPGTGVGEKSPMLDDLSTRHHTTRNHHNIHKDTNNVEPNSLKIDGETTNIVNHPAQLATTRWVWMDNLRGFSIVLVVVGHSGTAFWGTGWFYCVGNYPNWYRTITLAVFILIKSWLVPSFFFISGFLAPGQIHRKGVPRFLRSMFNK
jgi:hypothetical protein